MGPRVAPPRHSTAAHLDGDKLQGPRVAGQHAVQGDCGVGSVEVHAASVGGQARPLVASVHQLQRGRAAVGASMQQQACFRTAAAGVQEQVWFGEGCGQGSSQAWNGDSACSQGSHVTCKSTTHGSNSSVSTESQSREQGRHAGVVRELQRPEHV